MLGFDPSIVTVKQSSIVSQIVSQIVGSQMIQLSLTLKMTTARVVETSVTVYNDSPIQDFVRPDDQTQPTFEMTPRFKPFTVLKWNGWETLCYRFLLAFLDLIVHNVQ